MSLKRPLVLASFFGMLLTASLQGQEMVKEPSTGKSFPAAVSVAYNGVTYPLSLTGVTVRKKMIFKVYGMAHYIQDPVRGKKDAVLNAMTVDGKAKMIVMDFARDVDAAITNQQFARVLWSIWFGQNSIVDREDLVDRIVD